MDLLEIRPLCEGWIEKKVYWPESNIPPNSVKWKTRYALLTPSYLNNVEIRFCLRKPKNSSEITTENYSLSPWHYTVNINENEKDRPHIIRIQIYEHGYTSPVSVVLMMSMHSGEETLAWIRCIQNITKLNPVIRGHAFNVIPCNTLSSQNICVVDRDCIILFTAEAVILALKSNRSVVAVWPLSSIRSYVVNDFCHFTIISGRRSPLGKGDFSFKTIVGDGDRMFSLMDRYTGATSTVAVANQLDKFKRGKNNKKLQALKNQSRTRVPAQVSSSLNSRKSSDDVTIRQSNRLPGQEAREGSPISPPPPPQKPPRKPSHPGRHTSPTSNVINNRPSSADSGSQHSSAPSCGLYDLDKLLSNLEVDSTKNDVIDEDTHRVCREVLSEIVEEVASESPMKDSSFQNHPLDSDYKSSNMIVSEQSSSLAPRIVSPEPRLSKSGYDVIKRENNPQYSMVDFHRKSVKRIKNEKESLLS